MMLNLSINVKQTQGKEWGVFAPKLSSRPPKADRDLLKKMLKRVQHDKVDSGMTETGECLT